MVDLIGWVLGFLSTHPSGLLATLLFVFVVSIAGNLIPFFPTPYLVVIIGVVLDESYLGIIQIAAVAALGAATGKLVSYALGYGARRAIRKQERVDWEKRLLGHKDSLRSRLLSRLRNAFSREQRSEGQKPGQQDASP